MADNPTGEITDMLAAYSAVHTPTAQHFQIGQIIPVLAINCSQLLGSLRGVKLRFKTTIESKIRHWLCGFMGLSSVNKVIIGDTPQAAGNTSLGFSLTVVTSFQQNLTLCCYIVHIFEGISSCPKKCQQQRFCCDQGKMCLKSP